jgi:hypothetical protein
MNPDSSTRRAAPRPGEPGNPPVYADPVEAELPDEDLSSAEERVRAILETIAGERWLSLRVPAGFRLVSTSAERRSNLFPEGTEHVRVLARLELPSSSTPATVARRPQTTRTSTACAPGSSRTAAVPPGGSSSPTGRSARIDPTPRRRGEPGQHWQVSAEFRVER